MTYWASSLHEKIPIISSLAWTQVKNGRQSQIISAPSMRFHWFPHFQNIHDGVFVKAEKLGCQSTSNDLFEEHFLQHVSILWWKMELIPAAWHQLAAVLHHIDSAPPFSWLQPRSAPFTDDNPWLLHLRSLELLVQHTVEIKRRVEPTFVCLLEEFCSDRLEATGKYSTLTCWINSHALVASCMQVMLLVIQIRLNKVN